MYQFTTTNVINSAKDSNTAIDKYAGANGVFNVARVGSFKKDNVVSVYKTAYNASTLEVAKVKIPSVTSLDKVYRLTVDVRLINSTNSEYASTYIYFKKPVVVEVLGKSTAAFTAAALVDEIKKLKDRYGVSYITAEVINNTDYIQVTCTESHQRIKSMIIEEETASTSTLILPQYTDLSGTTFSVTTTGVQGFGDDEWMVRNIVLPTAENVRYFGINKDGRPIIGGNYSQYTLRYSIEKTWNDGIVAGGTSVTTHVFYVLESLVPSFETALAAAGIINIITIGGDVDLIIIGDQTMDLSETSEATQTLLVKNATGAVTWSSGTTGVATVGASTGVVTRVAAGSTVITATDSSSPAKTATFTITVIA